MKKRLLAILIGAVVLLGGAAVVSAGEKDVGIGGKSITPPSIVEIK